MFKVNKIWHHPQDSPRQLDLSCMTTPFEPGEQECIHAHTNLGACMFSINKEKSGTAIPPFSSLGREQSNVAHGCGPQNSVWQLPDLNRMITPFKPRQQECICACKYPGASMFSANKEMPGTGILDFSSLRTEHSNMSHSCHPQNSAWQLPNLNFMTPPFEPKQQECIHSHTNLGASMFSMNKEMPGTAIPDFSSLRTEQSNGAHSLLHCFPPSFQTWPSANVHLIENPSVFTFDLNKKASLNGVSGSPQKKYLVFDQSASGTRLVYSSVFPSVQDPMTVAAKLVSGYKSQCEDEAIKLNGTYPGNPVLNRTSSENHASEGSEMHEDTEEINALLYSDDSDNYDHFDDDDDEVASTGHSPSAVEGEYEKRNRAEEILEEVASTDGSSKRAKLMDGWYKRSSLMDITSSIKDEGSHLYDSDAKSCHAIGQTQGAEMVSILGYNPSRKDKIRTTMKILELVIPGAKGKDPSLVLDKAIDYLKSLKLKAKTLRVNN